MAIPSTIIDEGTSIRNLSTTAWQAFGSPQLFRVTQNLLAFNRGTSQPLGILPKLPSTLGGKIVYIDVMVIECTLDFNFLLGCDCVYFMGTLASSLFRVMCFPHEGRNVIIYQIIFIGPESTPNKPSSLNGSHMQMVLPPPQVNYMTTCSMPTSTYDLVGDVVCHVLEVLEPKFPIGSLDMYPFQNVVLAVN